MTTIRKPYAKHERVQVEFPEPSLAKQSMREEVDINQIVGRFRKTGLVTHLAKGQPQYLDVSEVRDYRAALEHVRSVGQFFEGLPADMRDDFGNDPAEFLDWITDPSNADEVKAYGLETNGSVVGDASVGDSDLLEEEQAPEES